MSLAQEQQWITGAEINRERRRLIDAGVPEDAPEFQELHARIRARDDYLYERYGKPLMDAHRGEWVAISTAGEVILGRTLYEVLTQSRQRFGPGNAALRKLDDFPGYQFHR